MRRGRALALVAWLGTINTGCVDRPPVPDDLLLIDFGTVHVAFDGEPLTADFTVANPSADAPLSLTLAERSCRCLLVASGDPVVIPPRGTADITMRVQLPRPDKPEEWNWRVSYVTDSPITRIVRLTASATLVPRISVVGPAPDAMRVAPGKHSAARLVIASRQPTKEAYAAVEVQAKKEGGLTLQEIERVCKNDAYGTVERVAYEVIFEDPLEVLELESFASNWLSEELVVRQAGHAELRHAIRWAVEHAVNVQPRRLFLKHQQGPNSTGILCATAGEPFAILSVRAEDVELAIAYENGVRRDTHEITCQIDITADAASAARLKKGAIVIETDHPKTTILRIPVYLVGGEGMQASSR